LNSGSVTASVSLACVSLEPASEAEAILVISNGTQVECASNVAKSQILYVKTRASPFFDTIPCKSHALHASCITENRTFMTCKLFCHPTVILKKYVRMV
jgi:hypothetical protein